ncbi:MAG: BlaI/MecI/CopY family transcriptional regulator [candidate division Zixibacteria bacterium]|nr:BlaI/MecI/CopY family transcriptional regulator [candidate division Zixibacteria bacterium]
MARSKSPTLTEAELRLMDILWEKGQATVGEVVESLPKSKALAYNTVLTTLRILEKKGYLAHEKDGRAFVYRPIVDRTKARRTALRYVMSRFFENSPELLVVNLLENEKLDAEEIERLKKLIDESE